MKRRKTKGKQDKKASLSAILRTGGIDEASFQDIYPNILDTNYEVIRIILIVGLAIFLGLTAIAILSTSLRIYLPVYIALLFILFAAYLLIKAMREQNPEVVSFCWYICAAVTYGYAIYMGTFMDPEMLGTVFCVLLVALPMLITDRPYKILLIITAASIVFILCTFLTKSKAVAITDLVNVLSFYALSAFLNIRMMIIRIREQKQRHFIEQQKNTDHLTGLLRRTAFTEQLNAKFEDPQTQGRYVIIDLDEFKRVNDLYGHNTGDEVIRQSARCITECLGSQAIIGRFGGDEFIAYVDESLSKESFDECIRKLLLRIPMDTNLPDKNDIIHCSVGIAEIPQGEKDLSEIFRKADSALYHSKRNGRNQSHYYTSDMPLMSDTTI